MRMTFKNGEELNGEPLINVSFLVISSSAFLPLSSKFSFPSETIPKEMDKEHKDKVKKKKIMKKEREESEINDTKMEERKLEVSRHKASEEIQEDSTTTCQTFSVMTVPENKEIVPEPLKENRNKIQDILIERGRNTPEGFYIAHPRNIKRTAHFKDVHSRKLSELLEAFHMFDFDRDGVINHDDLRKTFASLCVDVANEEIDQMLSEGLNPLNFDAFVILLGYKTLDLDPEEVLLDALSNWDDHQEGFISYESFTLLTPTSPLYSVNFIPSLFNASAWSVVTCTPLQNMNINKRPLMQHIMAWGDKFTEEEAIAALADAPIVLNKTKEKMIDYIQFSEDLCGLRKMMQRKTSKGD